MNRNQRIINLLAAGTICTNAGGNSMLRIGLSSSGTILSVSPVEYVRALGNGWVILGVVLLIGWMLMQLSLLSRADLSYVLPITSVSYVLNALVGVVFLHEHVSLTHWFGVFLIVAGVVVVELTKPLTRGSTP